MLRIQATYPSLRKATMWSGFAVSGGWLDISQPVCLGGEDHFNLEININPDNPNFNSTRFETAEALSRNLRGRYSNRETVPT